MSSSTQNKANMTLEKKPTNVVNKTGSSTTNVDTTAKKAPVKTETKKAVAKATVKRTPVKAAPKKASTSTSKTTINKKAPKKAEAQKHIADQISAFSSNRVWPD